MTRLIRNRSLTIVLWLQGHVSKNITVFVRYLYICLIDELFWRTVLYVERLQETVNVHVHSLGRPCQAHISLKMVIQEMRLFAWNIDFVHVPYHVVLNRVQFALLDRLKTRSSNFSTSNTCSTVLPGGNVLMYTVTYPSTEHSVLCERWSSRQESSQVIEKDESQTLCNQCAEKVSLPADCWRWGGRWPRKLRGNSSPSRRTTPPSAQGLHAPLSADGG